MGTPGINRPEAFEKTSTDGITVWRSHSVCPAEPDQPITIDLNNWIFFGKRIVLKNAR
jgi:hypothetical protein